MRVCDSTVLHRSIKKMLSFLQCAGLAWGPPMMVYRNKLSAYGGVSATVLIGVATYAIVTMLKLFIVATFMTEVTMWGKRLRPDT